MTNHEDSRKERDDLDRTLDAALAKYTSAEPRERLEERILANVREASTRDAQRACWNWGFAALAAFLLIAAALVWRWNQPTQTPVAVHPSVHPSTVKQGPVAPDLAHRDGNNAPPRSLPHRTPRHQPEPEVVAANPKLDVFPSPLPLSEQEKILASYVSQYPKHAALVAEARMDDLRQESEERRRIASERDERQ
jgi:hypothetical protein